MSMIGNCCSIIREHSIRFQRNIHFVSIKECLDEVQSKSNNNIKSTQNQRYKQSSTSNSIKLQFNSNIFLKLKPNPNIGGLVAIGCHLNKLTNSYIYIKLNDPLFGSQGSSSMRNEKKLCKIDLNNKWWTPRVRLPSFVFQPWGWQSRWIVISSLTHTKTSQFNSINWKSRLTSNDASTWCSCT